MAERPKKQNRAVQNLSRQRIGFVKPGLLLLIVLTLTTTATSAPLQAVQVQRKSSRLLENDHKSSTLSEKQRIERSGPTWLPSNTNHCKTYRGNDSSRQNSDDCNLPVGGGDMGLEVVNFNTSTSPSDDDGLAAVLIVGQGLIPTTSGSASDSVDFTPSDVTENSTVETLGTVQAGERTAGPPTETD